MFHRQWQDYFIGRQIRRQKLTAADLASVPRFTYREEAAAAVRGRVLTALLWLLVPAVALWARGFTRLRRYSVV